METLCGVKRLVATVDRVLSEHSLWGHRVNMQLQLKWSTAFTQKKSARGNTRKTGKTHFIASACIVSWRRLGIADASLSLWLPMGCASSQGDVRSTPSPGERHLKRERERERHCNMVCKSKLAKWTRPGESPRYDHKQCRVRRRRRLKWNHLNANELRKLNNSELAAKCQLCTIWPNKLCSFTHKHTSVYIYMYIVLYIYACLLCGSVAAAVWLECGGNSSEGCRDECGLHSHSHSHSYSLCAALIICLCLCLLALWASVYKWHLAAPPACQSCKIIGIKYTRTVSDSWQVKAGPLKILPTQ